jgi:hypothetical protein
MNFEVRESPFSSSILKKYNPGLSAEISRVYGND